MSSIPSEGAASPEISCSRPTDIHQHPSPTSASQINVPPLLQQHFENKISPPRATSHILSFRFLDLPTEIRYLIYDILLLNPLIGRQDSVRYSSGPCTRYDLWPAILATNRQINNEADRWLYEKNTLHMSIDRPESILRWNPYYHVCRSPLTRYMDEHDLFEAKDCHRASMVKVRRWSIWLYVEHHYPYAGSFFGFYSLARTIRQISFHQLELCVIDLTKNINVAFPPGPITPFTLLRRGSSVTIRDEGPGRADEIAHLKGLLDRDHVPYHPYTWPIQRDKFIAEKLRFLARTNLVECAGDMFDRLDEFVQTFLLDRASKEFVSMGDYERSLKYKQEEHKNGWVGDNVPQFELATLLRQALLEARRASENNWLARFKKRRNVVLKYLEIQYRGIETASNNVLVFVRLEKRFSGHLEPISVQYSLPPLQECTQCQSASILLKDYLSSYSQLWNHCCRPTESDKEAKYEATKHFSVLETSLAAGDCQETMRLFRELVDLLDTDFLAMRKARQALFNSDFRNERGCDIDPDVNASTELIVWTVAEPAMSPFELPTDLGSVVRVF